MKVIYSEKKKFYKSWYFWVIGVIVLLILLQRNNYNSQRGNINKESKIQNVAAKKSNTEKIGNKMDAKINNLIINFNRISEVN